MTAVAMLDEEVVKGRGEETKVEELDSLETELEKISGEEEVKEQAVRESIQDDLEEAPKVEEELTVTEPPPEAKNDVATPEPEAPVAPETSEPTGKDWAEFRLALKEKDKMLEELSSKVSSLETAKAEPEPVAEAPRQVAGTVIGMMIRAKSGMLTDAELANTGSEDNTITLCHKALSSEVGAEDLKEVWEQAQLGRFGDDSSDVANLAAQYLNIASSRELAEFKSQNIAERESIQQQKQNEEARNGEIQKAAIDFPELAKAGTDANKYINVWNQENIGTVDAKGKANGDGKLPQHVAQYLADHPYDNIKMVADSFSTPESTSVLKSELEKAKTQLAELKKAQGLSDALPTSGPIGEVKSTGASSDIEAELAALSASSRR